MKRAYSNSLAYLAGVFLLVLILLLPDPFGRYLPGIMPAKADTLSSPDPEEDRIEFSDVQNTKSAYYYDAVYWAAENQITEGYPDGTFHPEKDCTRSQIITFLWRLAGRPEPESTEMVFKDVKPGTYYYKAVLWAVENHITAGYPDGTFRPGNRSTRQQAVTLLWRMAGQPESTFENNFKDISDPNTYFYKAVLWAAENRITEGYPDGSFHPEKNCTRAQMITFLYRYHNAFSQGNDPQPEKPVEITLTGRNEDHVITDRLCYVQDEKFVLLIEPGMDLPGDLADNIAMIIDRIEEVTGLTYEIPGKLGGFDNSTCQYGYNPWKDFEFGYRVPIFINLDEENAGYISCATALCTDIYLYELISEKTWNSIPDYRDNPWKLSDHIDYYTFAHELTHVLTLRYAEMPKIMTEGGADYVAAQVIHSLASVSPDFEKSDAYILSAFDHSVKDPITPSNAETVFRDDYSTLSMADRGDEYTLGCMISTFLADRYGDAFLKDYLDVCAKAGFAYPYFGSYEEAERNKLTDEFKKLFGEDVFTAFGAYYQSHSY